MTIDLVFLPAHQLAQLIRDRQVSSVEVLEAHLAQIDRHNAQLNAICTLDADRARQRAGQADEALARGENWGVLHGIPITIKDIFETARLRTTAGYESLKNYIPQQDATAVARLRGAGAIVMGKTNPAELASDWQGINHLFDRANNPWNLDYTPGGSSSGSAAAVAAGLSPLDIGDDFGGSIRQPSHFCGIYGLKPTDRRVPTRGHIPELPGTPKCIRQMLTIGPLARSIEDLRLCLQLIAGADLLQPDIPPVPLDVPSSRSLRELRIAWADEFPSFPVAAEIKAAIRLAANTLSEAGAIVESWRPELDFVAAWQIGFATAVYNSVYAQPMPSGRFLLDKLAFMFREATQGDRTLRNLGSIPGITLPIFLRQSLKGYFETLTERDILISQLDRQLEAWDVWLCPVAMTAAFTHRATGEAVEVDDRRVPYMMASGAYTGLFSLTGHPVVVIPIGRTKNGLPIGLQIVGKRWREMELLEIATEIDTIVGNFRNPLGY